MSHARLLIKSKAKASFSWRYVAIIVPLILVGLAACYAHISIRQAGDDYIGLLAPLDRLFDLLLASVVIGVAFCAGRMVSRMFSLSFAGAAEELSFSVMLGTGVIGLGVLGLGLLGLLTALPVAIFLIALVGIAFREVPRLLGVIKDILRGATATKARLVAALLFGALILIMMLRAATPPHAFDEAIYHLPVTKSFVEQGRVYAVVDNWAGNMPFLIHMIYAICLIAKADIAAKIFSLFMALMCSLALYSFCSRFLSSRAGMLAMFGFFGAGVVVEVAVTARIDASLAGMLFFCTYAMVLYFETGQRGWLFASAVLAGFALGIKHTAALWILLLGVMFLIESFFKRPVPLAKTITRGVVYAAIALAVASPWYIKNLAWFHNAIYPYMTGEVADFAPEQVRYFTPEDELKLDAHFDVARKRNPGLVAERSQELAWAVSVYPIKRPPRFWEYFTKPNLYNHPEDYHYPNYLFLLAPLLFFLPKSRWLVWLVVLSLVYFVLISRMSWYNRYLLPVYPPLTLVSVYALVETTRRTDLIKWLRTGLSRVLPALAIAIAVGSIALLSITQTLDLRGADFIAGELSRRGFMSSMFYYPPLEFINRNLPQNARVMMIGAQMYYDLQRDCIPDITYDTTGWRRLLMRNGSLAEAHLDLKRQGVTHLLVSYGIFSWAATAGRRNASLSFGNAPPPNPEYKVQLRNWVTLDQYTANFVEQIYSDKKGFILYRLK